MTGDCTRTAPVAFADVSNDPSDPAFESGWYPDPIGRFELRFHNGVHWTADVSTSGTRFVDPLGLAPPTSRDTTNSVATAAMILGIVAVTTAWMPFLVVLGVVTATIALALGVTGLRRSTRSGVGRGRAVAGIAMGASAIAAAVIGVLLTAIVLDVYDDYVDPAPHETAVTSCEVVGSRASMTGELTNLGDDTAEFSVLVGFLRPGTDNPHATKRIIIGEVGAGATEPFDAQHQVDLDDVDCAIVEVNGPLPFGLSLD